MVKVEIQGMVVVHPGSSMNRTRRCNEMVAWSAMSSPFLRQHECILSSCNWLHGETPYYQLVEGQNTWAWFVAESASPHACKLKRDSNCTTAPLSSGHEKQGWGKTLQKVELWVVHLIAHFIWREKRLEVRINKDGYVVANSPPRWSGVWNEKDWKSRAEEVWERRVSVSRKREDLYIAC